MSDSDSSSSTVPGDSFEDRVKKVMMGEFDNMLKLINKREDNTFEHLNGYLRTRLITLQELAQQIKDNQNTLTDNMRSLIRRKVDQIMTKGLINSRVNEVVNQMLREKLDVERRVNELIRTEFMTQVGNIQIEIKKGDVENFVHGEIDKVRGELGNTEKVLTGTVNARVEVQVKKELKKLGIDKPKPKVDTAEIKDRIYAISNQVLLYKKKVDELATSVQLVSTMPAEIQTLNERIEVIGGWYPYDNSQFFIRKVRDPQCKTHEELLYLRRGLDDIDINAVNEKIEEIEREITNVKKKLYPEDDAGNTPSGWWFGENDPNPASQLPAVRKGELKQDLAVLIKDLPLLHM